MNPTDEPGAELRVGAHVLVQLGSELVTDVEQAILESVKNSYDADAPGCLIVIETHEKGVRIETGIASKLRPFTQSSETVSVELFTADGKPIVNDSDVDQDEVVKRYLTYTGRVMIEDKGDGLTPEQLKDSWLVISRSNKRASPNSKKAKTPKGRTPLGDKGLGRLGSMKLGDILLVETATSPNEPIASAQFRWADCEVARTVDEIPVYLEMRDNRNKFKGTRVSVLGLRDLAEWRRRDRVNELTRSLARLISPFESTSTFPVNIKLDGVDQSLVTVTDEVLKRAIAEFHFSWQLDPADPEKHELVAEARFRKRLFTSIRNKRALARTKKVFDLDGGQGFATSLESYSRLKGYEQKAIDIDGPWFIKLKRVYRWSDMQFDSGASIKDPGSFTGAFYFFHFDNIGDPDETAAAGLGIDRQLIKGMTGISILRDGFRVRSQGDWLELSSGMTSGSTYGMRVDNTVGYFALTGEHNFQLVEKSDREGFVEDSTYRGFMQIARHCKSFANDSLEQVRRGLDEYYKKLLGPDVSPVAPTVAGSFRAIESGVQSAENVQAEAGRIAIELKSQFDVIEKEAYTNAEPSRAAARALKLANNAIKAMGTIEMKLSAGVHSGANLARLRQEFDDRDEQAVALIESAAVGLSARGLAHELRTHLTEIRHRASVIEKAVKGGDVSIVAHIRAIRSSCAAISSAASLIDPMLPRSRALKENIQLRAFVENYFKMRGAVLERAGVRALIHGEGVAVRANRPRLTQILDNLVRNSVYWIQRGEMVSGIHRKKEVSVDLTSFGFLVFDTGPGVDPHYEESLFEIFVTAKPDRSSGQGLGLFITSELLRIDGCDIQLLPDRNENGNRNTFAVNLSPLVVKE